MSRGWNGRLRHYRRHRNDEHLLALIQEATRYIGFHLESDLSQSDFWGELPLWKAAAVLLFLVDQGVVERSWRGGRRVFEPLADAESWVQKQPVVGPWRTAFCELLAALRHELGRRTRSRQS